jgi:glycosyltransferase involved in cell wall biosynthesis
MITPFSAQELAQAIIYMRDNPAYRDELAENAYELYKDIFTTDKIGDTLLRYIKKLLSKND